MDNLAKLVIESGVSTTIVVIFIGITLKYFLKLEPTLEVLRQQTESTINALAQNASAFNSFSKSLETLTVVMSDLAQDKRDQHVAVEQLIKITEIVALDTKDAKSITMKADDKVDRLHTEVAKANAKMELIIDELHIGKKPEIDE